MSTATHHQSPPTLPLANPFIAARLDEVADRLETHEANPFRVRAYRIAADTVRHLDRPVADILGDEGLDGLDALPGIGPTLARAIEQLALSGELEVLDRLRAEDGPAALFADIPGIGPGLAKRIHDELGVRTLAELEQAAHDGRLAAFPGVGSKKLRGIRDVLAGRLSRRPAIRRTVDGPPVADLLEVDRIYRERAGAGLLRRVAPRRFNPSSEPVLPVLKLRRHGRRYVAMYSNTALAHQRKATRDWVVIFCDDHGHRSQSVVLTAKAGPCRGRRIVRGREHESADLQRSLWPEPPAAA
jgi:DNA polymerase (family 10)